MVSPGATKCIALLTNDVISAYQSAFRDAVERAARAAGFNTLSVMGRDLEHIDRHECAQNVIYRWLSPQSVDGVVLLAGSLGNYSGMPGLLKLRDRLKPLPTVSIGLVVPELPSIIVENRAAMRMAVEHVLDHDRKRIAYIGGPSVNAEALARFAGYRDALESRGVPLDHRIITEGRFTLPSGEAAMRELLTTGAGFDAVVAANDYMAIGAMDVLRNEGVEIPEDVLVVGFDNSPIARFASRSLSSVSQPTEQMALAAVQRLTELINGGTPPLETTVAAELVVRESCGCAYSSADSDQASQQPRISPAEFVCEQRKQLLADMAPNRDQIADGWQEQLLEALSREFCDEPGTFLRKVQHLAEAERGSASYTEKLARAIMCLQRAFQRAGYHGASNPRIEQLWLRASATVTAAITRDEGRTSLDQLVRSVGLRRATQRISLAFEPSSLAAELERSLPDLGVARGYVALKARDEEQLRPLVALNGGQPMSVPAEPYSVRQLLPEGFPCAGLEPWSLIIMALTFESEVLGLIAFGGSTDSFVCEALRSQISASLKMGELHTRVVEQRALHERLAREQLMGEVAIAKRIQTALAPHHLHAPGLALAGSMVPADQIGGDYYDVLPTHEGCWLGIGDVTGHGLLSGLIMLMLQSMVSALVKARPDASPAELVITLNRALGPNIRERLGKDDYASLALLHVHQDGRVVYAGCHDDFIVCRASTGRCELIALSGIWVGFLDDISEQTADAEFKLEPGDLLVLLTDGMFEARNALKEQLGYERLCKIIEAHAQASPEVIYTQLMSALHSWAPVQQDDATCLVARYTGT